MVLNSRHSFYTSDLWKNCKQEVYNNKKNEYGVVCCENCGKPLLKTFNPKAKDNRSSIIYHHTIELTDENYMDYNISLNPALIQILCFRCHNLAHERFNGKPRKKVYLVYGSPCSGKTTWVNEQLGENDVVLDIDSLWQYVSGKPRYIKPNAYRDIVLALWDDYIDKIKMRTGYWDNAYIIMGKELASSSSRKQRAESLDAELIHIDTDINECKRRLYENPQGRSIEEWNKYIDEYFDRFTE